MTSRKQVTCNGSVCPNVEYLLVEFWSHFVATGCGNLNNYSFLHGRLSGVYQMGGVTVFQYILLSDIAYEFHLMAKNNGGES